MTEPVVHSHHPLYPGEAAPGFDARQHEWSLDPSLGWLPGNPAWLSSGPYFYRLKDRAGTSPTLPDNNPKTAAGALKTPLLSVVPASALLQMGEVMRLGKAKYGPYNWRDHPVTYSTYVDAAMRHLMQFWDGETMDPESGQSHIAHAMAGLAVLADAIATGNATDDRPKPGAAADLIANFKASRG